MIFGGVALCSGATERNTRTMGMVLSFVPRPAPVNRAARDTGTPAAVIIFPGVRYEQPPLTGQSRPADPNEPPRTPVPHH
ncbi:hypothetical protein EN742_36095 [Mesorhizobium sp. M4A.F.Ca.ET.020.02.1.1]|nr:hypothetical protein EOA33_34250 [Mesorhizobium sp. M4A.F.Ca.ET.050.02.1.1]RVC78261.1 hypothetical protein EN745_19415 [Mesorhizobium sp. M4A.F.Ca.ET.022.05.2.1]RVD24604.1 hypothetical protein EN742_36095 [Mesorhizobium sp. M4A.F.Ca.ET.020.02.1.1]RVD69963.1 hypothetical protein EN751_23260 [Mesorhizobium sp. M4A.F.Ca.ET.029.04.2.1]RWC22340.1 MAG: hypothetical protein EOS53_01995 [Mesorhizobium sp.]